MGEGMVQESWLSVGRKSRRRRWGGRYSRLRLLARNETLVTTIGRDVKVQLALGRGQTLDGFQTRPYG